MDEKYPALRYSDNMWEDCKNGVWTVECNSWKEFENRMEEYKEYKYMWRGQSCEKPLLPAIYRGHNTPDENIEQHLNQFRNDMPGADVLKQFLKQAEEKKTVAFEDALSEYYKIIHPKADTDDPKENYIPNFINDIYWAIGQHHGLKTPILDWTEKPYNALFFAFCERKEQDDKRIVYGLAEKSRLLLNEGKRRYIEFLTKLNFVQKILDSTDRKERIEQMFGRIKAQDGLFTRTLYNEDIEKHVKKCYDCYKKKNEEIVFLIKILIPNGVREDFLKRLEEKKITYKKMFPDLQGAALHCNLKLFGPDGRLLGKHRKLRPTAAERLIWGDGDGSTLTVLDTSLGRIGGLLCWENYMPLARMAIYGKGVEIYVAPTLDDKDTWQHSMCHIAFEGRCFVLGCCQYFDKSMFPADLPGLGDLADMPEVLCRGGSAIISPMGEVMAGPLFGQEGILTAKLDMGAVTRARYDFDVVGHYSRPDVFELRINESPMPPSAADE